MKVLIFGEKSSRAFNHLFTFVEILLKICFQTIDVFFFDIYSMKCIVCKFSHLRMKGHWFVSDGPLHKFWHFNIHANHSQSIRYLEWKLYNLFAQNLFSIVRKNSFSRFRSTEKKECACLHVLFQVNKSLRKRNTTIWFNHP